MYVDKRLAGITAVQTLSRLNRSYHGPFGDKDTTYVIDFVNEPQDILAAFKTYYETAELENVTDPNLVFNLRSNALRPERLAERLRLRRSHPDTRLLATGQIGE